MSFGTLFLLRMVQTSRSVCSSRQDCVPSDIMPHTDTTYPIHIYVLELEDGFWYVGKTHHPKSRFWQHTHGKGAEWTKLHRVVRCAERRLFYVETEYDEDRHENETTLEWMKREGWRQVRGGAWCEVSEEKTLRKLHRAGYLCEVKSAKQTFAAQSGVRYVLELADGYYYVGYARNLKLALRHHEYGRGAAWTRLHKPLRLVSAEPFETPGGAVQNRRDIDPLVIDCFRRYGYDRVRGGSFTAVDEKEHLATLIRLGVEV